MLIDAHVHLLPERVLRDRETVAAAEPWFAACHPPERRIATEAELMAHMERHGIDRTVVFTWPFRDAELCREANDFAAALQRRHPDRVIAFGIVQPLDPGAEAEIHRCASLGLRGIGELNADAQGWLLEDDTVSALASRGAGRELVWNLHCSEPVGHGYAGKGTATPDRVADFCRRCPDLRIVLSHLGGGLPFYAHMPEVAELCRRLWFDTAAIPFLYRPTALRTVADLCGPDRLLLGTDFPLLELPRYLDALTRAGLDDGARDAVLGGNAASLFG